MVEKYLRTMISTATRVTTITLGEALRVRHAAYFPDSNDSVAIARLDCDDGDATMHFGIIDSSMCVAAGSLTEHVPSPRICAESSFQLRGMAVLPRLHGGGLGSEVLRYAIEQVAERGGGLLWGNIRSPARAFYERQGFTLHADTYFLRLGGSPHHYGHIHIEGTQSKA
jgi:GNAT superfamily N-acetyltransferase